MTSDACWVVEEQGQGAGHERGQHPGQLQPRQQRQVRRGLIIMEYAGAGDLAATIKRQKERRELIPEAQVISWFVQITFGLQYIHKKNILHRDLRTQNIFLTSQNLVKIGDFGISKSLTHTLDLATTAIGTPHYLSPEICKRLPYNHKSDMWSLGCVLYEMCTLQLAFPVENFISLVQSICRGTYKPISSQYEEKVSDLIQVLLRPVPDRRPAAEQLLTCSKLETEVAAYFEYIEALKRTGRTESVSSSGDGGSVQGSGGVGDLQTQL